MCYFSLGSTDVPPSVVSGPSTQSVLEGTNMQFSCKVNGIPKPSVAWFRHNDVAPLQNSSATVMTQSGQTFRLSILNISLNDQGRFKCVASSKFGTHSKDAELLVKSKLLNCDPEMFVEKKYLRSLEATASDNGTIQLSCYHICKNKTMLLLWLLWTGKRGPNLPPRHIETCGAQLEGLPKTS